MNFKEIITAENREKETGKVYEILIIDDDIDFQDIISMSLQEKGYIIHHAYNAHDAEYVLSKQNVDLILLDLMLPDIDGFAACRTIKEFHPDCFVPIIMISAKADTQSKVRGLEEGAVDFLTKPFSIHELHARVRTMLRLKYLQDQLKALAITDELTGLYNRRFFQEWLILEFNRSLRYKTDLSCLMFDIDYFKSINDTYGHPVGDFILTQVAAIVKQNIRATDVAARFGGEEFIVLLPRTSRSLATGLAERIRAAIEAARFLKDDIALQVTVSAGVSSSFQNNLEDRSQLIELTDQALYDAKRRGRNTVSYKGMEAFIPL